MGQIVLTVLGMVVMLSQASEQYPPSPVWLHVYVSDVDPTYGRALPAGGESVQAPVKKEDPDRRGGVKDQAGKIWWIATSLAEATMGMSSDELNAENDG